MAKLTKLNADSLEKELKWFSKVLETRFKLYFGQEGDVQSVQEIPPPKLTKSNAPYLQILKHYQMSFAERLMVVLALVPHIRPRLLDVFFTKNKTFDRRFTEFGGVLEGTEGDFFPTCETLVFILAGSDLEMRFELQNLFDRDHFFTKHHIFDLHHGATQRPLMKSPLKLTDEYLSYFTTGSSHRPHFTQHFPAKFIETKLQWEDLVLSPSTLAMTKEIESWIENGSVLMDKWGMSNKLRPGLRALFYGPPGTGKTMTACLLGKATNHDVYKIDLSMVVSKYIGETEKNLARVFDKAEQKQWILFFDEADALFGKRSDAKSANDRYANQEVAYLLQRIENFNGIAILASNLKGNLDPAFTRRFEITIHFPIPDSSERLQLWKKGFSSKAKLDKNLDLQKIANKYELSGGAIMNVIRYASLQAIQKKTRTIELAVVLQGIRRELRKEGKVL